MAASPAMPIHTQRGVLTGRSWAAVFVIAAILNENVKYCRKAVCNQTMAENGKIRVAAIGVGSLGRHHARNYGELTAEGRVEFVGICDVDAATAARVSAEHECTSFPDWHDLRGKVDAVSIATPTETHCAIACAFLDAGVHVLVEKPIALTLDEA